MIVENVQLFNKKIYKLNEMLDFLAIIFKWILKITFFPKKVGIRKNLLKVINILKIINKFQ